MKIKKFRTDILIDNDISPNDDLQFIRSKGYKPTSLLRAKIRELKAKNTEPESLTLSIQNANLSKLVESLLDFLEKKGLLGEFHNN